MPKGKKQTEVSATVTPIVETTTTEGYDIATIQLPKTEFTVLNSSGGEVRTYSFELHGENAEALAHQYASKIGGSVR